METKDMKKVKKSSRPLCLAVYKPLPKGWKESRHYFFYGWAITPNILQSYLTKHDYRGHDNFTSVGTVAVDLEQRSGYHHINIVQGKVEGLPTHLQDRIASTEQLGPTLLVFAISCTRARELFNRRPTKEQLRRLTELLGEEPSWFEDRWTKEEFDLDLVL